MKNFKQYLTEVFERSRNKYINNYKSPDGSIVYYELQLKDHSINIEFHQYEKEIYSIIFVVDGSIDRKPQTNAVSGIEIYNAVLNTCLDFLDDGDGDINIFFSPHSEGNEKVYKLLFKDRERFRKLGYIIKHDEDANMTIISKAQ